MINWNEMWMINWNEIKWNDICSHDILQIIAFTPEEKHNKDYLDILKLLQKI